MKPCEGYYSRVGNIRGALLIFTFTNVGSKILLTQAISGQKHHYENTTILVRSGVVGRWCPLARPRVWIILARFLHEY